MINENCPYAYIDGSYNAKTEEYSFGGVLVINEQVHQFSKKYEKDEFSVHRNISGEIKGAGFIINYCLKQNIKEVNIYYDYAGIEFWYTGAWSAKTPISIKYKEFANLVKDKIKVNFIKVKSHSKIAYNDLADKLAKEALGLS